MNNVDQEQKQPPTNQIKLFDQIYKRKFTNENMTQLAEKRRIVASQIRRKKPDINQNLQQSPWKTLKKSKTIGSLLPRLKQIQLIANTDKKPNKKPSSHSLSKLSLYLSQKNIRKQQQFNIMFLTQNNSIIPDRVINEKFSQLIAMSLDQKPKNLRTLLNLTGGSQFTDQGKKKKIQSQKQQLRQIFKRMVQQHNIEDQKLTKQQQQSQKSQEQIHKTQQRVKNQQVKGIGWVIKQCKKYNKKFRVGKQKSKPKKKIANLQ